MMWLPAKQDPGEFTSLNPVLIRPQFFDRVPMFWRHYVDQNAHQYVSSRSKTNIVNSCILTAVHSKMQIILQNICFVNLHLQTNNMLRALQMSFSPFVFQEFEKVRFLSNANSNIWYKTTFLSNVLTDTTAWPFDSFTIFFFYFMLML